MFVYEKLNSVRSWLSRGACMYLPARHYPLEGKSNVSRAASLARYVYTALRGVCFVVVHRLKAAATMTRPFPVIMQRKRLANFYNNNVSDSFPRLNTTGGFAYNMIQQRFVCLNRLAHAQCL